MERSFDEVMDMMEERRRRINIAAYAYAYEFDADPLVDDATYDREALLIRPQMSTGNDVLDEFFRTHFDPCTGMWIHSHPDLQGVERVVDAKRRSRR